MKRNIKDISLDKWPETFKSLGLKPYAHKQIFQWLFKKGVTSFDEMTNLSKADRAILEENFYLNSLKLLETLEDKDGTKKFLFELEDGERIETVSIPMEGERTTLCISSQVGCALGCQFCRTAGMGFIRNLSQAEIVDQVLAVISPVIARSETTKQSPVNSSLTGDCFVATAPRNDNAKSTAITNIVFMGMGEPLHNYENVKRAIQILADEDGPFFARRRITLSTAGVVPGIREMTKDKLGVKLAVSLNATTDEMRREIMPVAKNYSIDDIIEACREYAPPGSRWRTTFEYVLIEEINDSLDDAKRLVKLLSRLPSKVNLIPYNPFPGSTLKKPKQEVLKNFYNYLYKKGIQVNMRQSKGADILAACGQLVGK